MKYLNKLKLLTLAKGINDAAVELKKHLPAERIGADVRKHCPSNQIVTDLSTKVVDTALPAGVGAVGTRPARARKFRRTANPANTVTSE
jgi:hypothetical protein